MREFQFTVEPEDVGLGVKAILRRHFRFSSRLFARLKAQRRVFLNNRPLQGWMKPQAGDIIRAVMPEEVSHFPPEDIPIDVIYEDEDLLIVNKQAGLTVHPTKGHPDHTIANGVMTYMQNHGQSYKIRFVNRLDMDTTGLLIIGKHSHAQDELTRQMKDGRLKKYYHALVDGVLREDSLTIDTPIGHPDPDAVTREVVPDGEGRPCVTHVRVLERFARTTLVEIRLETGRTHQIRVHLTSIGHPLCGDPLYGGARQDLLDHQALHAVRLTFEHPVTGKPVVVTAPYPEELKKAIEKAGSERAD